MNQAPTAPIAPTVEVDEKGRKIFTAGTLRYTTFGLVSLLLWLVWGEFFWVILDQNLPKILPLKLNQLGANDTVNAILNKSISYAVIFFLAPLVSVWSDRYRSRIGRRIPFLLWSTPLVGLFMIMIGSYDKLIFPHMMDNFDTIFIVGGIAYILGFGLMCLFVKEGTYPPPPEKAAGKAGTRFGVFKTFFKECFTHRFYWYIFLTYMFQYVSYQAGIFGILRNTKSLGLTLQQLGNVDFYAGFISLALIFPAGWLADKFHPVRVYLVASCWVTGATATTRCGGPFS